VTPLNILPLLSSFVLFRIQKEKQLSSNPKFLNNEKRKDTKGGNRKVAYIKY